MPDLLSTISYIYFREYWLTPILSIAAGTVTDIYPDDFGLTVEVSDGARTRLYKNMSSLNIILGEHIKDEHLVGYILKGGRS